MSGATVGLALSVGAIPPAWLTLQALKGTERTSQLFRFKLRVETPIPAPELEIAAIGSSATLFLRAAGHTRQIHGVVCAVRREDAHVPAAPSYAVFTLEMVPHAWLLTRRLGSRIFQDVSVVEVINTVLDAYQLPRRWVLERARPPRPYVTQYEETDWDFLCRLAAENGIFFNFAHDPIEYDPVVEAMLSASELGSSEAVAAEVGSAVLGALLRARNPREEIVFTDLAFYMPISGGGVIPSLHAGAMAAGEDYVLKMTSKRAIRPTRSKFLEYDWRRPQLLVDSSAERGPTLDRPGEPDDLEVYEHHLRDHGVDWADEAFEAARMLNAARREAVVSRGSSSSVRMATGQAFVLEGHGLEDGPYAITKVRHSASRRVTPDVPHAYSNTFEAIPATVPCVQPRPARRTVQACITATVAGPEDEDIHVNEHGQIKVKMHWDRRDERHEPTCWIRCMHPWAGNGWGHQFIPRVGMEVVVAFEGGDPDRPLVLGSVYNGTTAEPFTLPANKTRSGIRTMSSPEPVGFNELSFEDRSHEEQILLKAQRDFDSVVQRDRTAAVQRDDHETVGNDQLQEVRRNQRLRVHAHREIHVGGDVRDTTVGDHVVERGNLTTTVHGDRADAIEGRLDSVVREDRYVETHGNHVDVVGQTAAIIVGHGAHGGDYSLGVRGRTEIASSGAVDISSQQEIVLRVGQSFIRIASGQIDVVSPKLTLRGEDARILLAEGNCKVKANGNFQVVSDAVILRSAGASLGLKTQATLAGSQVLLNSPEQATDQLEAVESSTTEVTLRDDEGNPLPFQRFRVTFDDGDVFMGVTDADGNAVVEGQGSGQIEFPDHTNPEEA